MSRTFAKYPHLLVYDGECGLCTRSVQFVLRHDRRKVFRFCPIQSPLGQQIYSEVGLKADAPSTMIAVVEGELYIKSNAVLHLALSLDGIWPIAGILLLIPRRIRDRIYDWIAGRRKMVFKTSRHCLFDPSFKERLVLE